MRLRAMLLAVTLAALPCAAWAQPIQGFYISGGAGARSAQNTGTSDNNAAFGGSRLRMQQALGYELLGSVGYALGNGARFEIEGDFSRNAFAGLGRVTSPFTASGTVSHYGVMANALFDMDIGLPWLYPYLGVGAGYQITSLNNAAMSQIGGPFSYRSNGSQGGFAVQAIAGLSFPVPNMPGLSITPEYRVMDILGGQKFNGTLANGTAAQIKLHSQIDHNFIIGVRYAFDVPPPQMPAAAPVPAPAAARSYLVFFDWDKSTLTERARGIVRDAAANATKTAYTRIDVNGNADTSGNHTYNQGLSMRRAQTVAAELVKDGVPKTAIAITASGDTHLLVPTGPGVREPQNRRVEIVIK